MSREPRESQDALFRRRRFVAPHRRRRLVARLAKPFASAAAIVVLPAALGFWILTSPQFLVGELTVGPTGRVSAAWVETQLLPLMGRHLFFVRLSEIEERLAGHPWIESIDMRKELPARLEVAVHERLPAALWRERDGLVFLDRLGRVIGPFTPAYGSVNLFVLSSSGNLKTGARAAIELADEWQRLRSGDIVSEVDILSPREFRVVVDRLPFAVLIGIEDLASTLAGFERALPLIVDRYPNVGSVDLRFSNQIVFQPAAELPTREG